MTFDEFKKEVQGHQEITDLEIEIICNAYLGEPEGGRTTITEEEIAIIANAGFEETFRASKIIENDPRVSVGKSTDGHFARTCLRILSGY